MNDDNTLYIRSFDSSNIITFQSTLSNDVISSNTILQFEHNKIHSENETLSISSLNINNESIQIDTNLIPHQNIKLGHKTAIIFSSNIMIQNENLFTKLENHIDNLNNITDTKSYLHSINTPEAPLDKYLTLYRQLIESNLYDVFSGTINYFTILEDPSQNVILENGLITIKPIQQNSNYQVIIEAHNDSGSNNVIFNIKEIKTLPYYTDLRKNNTRFINTYFTSNATTFLSQTNEAILSFEPHTNIYSENETLTISSLKMTNESIFVNANLIPHPNMNYGHKQTSIYSSNIIMQDENLFTKIENHLHNLTTITNTKSYLHSINTPEAPLDRYLVLSNQWIESNLYDVFSGTMNYFTILEDPSQNVILEKGMIIIKPVQQYNNYQIIIESHNDSGSNNIIFHIEEKETIPYFTDLRKNNTRIINSYFTSNVTTFLSQTNEAILSFEPHTNIYSKNETLTISSLKMTNESILVNANLIPHQNMNYGHKQTSIYSSNIIMQNENLFTKIENHLYELTTITNTKSYLHSINTPEAPLDRYLILSNQWIESNLYNVFTGTMNYFTILEDPSQNVILEKGWITIKPVQQYRNYQIIIESHNDSGSNNIIFHIEEKETIPYFTDLRKNNTRIINSYFTSNVTTFLSQTNTAVLSFEPHTNIYSENETLTISSLKMTNESILVNANLIPHQNMNFGHNQTSIYSSNIMIQDENLFTKIENQLHELKTITEFKSYFDLIKAPEAPLDKYIILSNVIINYDLRLIFKGLIDNYRLIDNPVVNTILSNSIITITPIQCSCNYQIKVGASNNYGENDFIFHIREFDQLQPLYIYENIAIELSNQTFTIDLNTVYSNLIDSFHFINNPFNNAIITNSILSIYGVFTSNIYDVTLFSSNVYGKSEYFNINITNWAHSAPLPIANITNFNFLTTGITFNISDIFSGLIEYCNITINTSNIASIINGQLVINETIDSSNEYNIEIVASNVFGSNYWNILDWKYNAPQPIPNILNYDLLNIDFTCNISNIFSGMIEYCNITKNPQNNAYIVDGTLKIVGTIDSSNAYDVELFSSNEFGSNYWNIHISDWKQTHPVLILDHNNFKNSMHYNTLYEFKNTNGHEHEMHTFNVPNGDNYYDILLVGGGGGGGAIIGGGGGAGGVVNIENILMQEGTYNIKVGKGGNTSIKESLSQTQSNVGKSGYNSEINFDNLLYSNQIAFIGYGGGGGGIYNNIQGKSGGSSGGGGNPSANNLQENTFWNGSSFVVGGHKGGISTERIFNSGGGGAGGIGLFNEGGPGVSVAITGENVFYAAGGGGGNYDNPTIINTGGSFIGGNGWGFNLDTQLDIKIGPHFGAPNTGSGGGGGSYSKNTFIGGAGGSGIVIIRRRIIPIESNVYQIYINNLTYDYIENGIKITLHNLSNIISQDTYIETCNIIEYDNLNTMHYNNNIGLEIKHLEYNVNYLVSLELSNYWGNATIFLNISNNNY